MDSPAAPPHQSSIHFRPRAGRLADTIPFFWKGQYHIFYLRAIDRVPWEHIVSGDLVHWKELPTALQPDGPADGPDGMHMFTGSAIERDGVFHIFYTGWNANNPNGREFIMHATSPDLVAWTKHPQDMIAPDGVHYANHRDRDFRDAYVFWNDQEQRYWMLLFANDVQTRAGVVGVAVSKDLAAWQQVEPIAGIEGQECPDLFRIGDTWYLLGGSWYSYAKDVRGPYRRPRSSVLDTSFIYAGKRMFDGKRHLWSGWLRDLSPAQDGGAGQWGGTQCVPRELYAGPEGQLHVRPVGEALAAFDKEVLNLADKPSFHSVRSSWSRQGAALLGRGDGGSQVGFDVPDNYLMRCTVQLEGQAELTLALREQPGGGQGYQLVLRPAKQEAQISGRTFCQRRNIDLDASRPIAITAFVQGTIIECFVNDAYAFSCRAYDCPNGRGGLSVSGGQARLLKLSVNVAG